MERRDNIEPNQIQQKNCKEKNGDISEVNKYKYLKRSSAFEYDCNSCGDKISFKLTFDLIEENFLNDDENMDKKPKQFISINAKPFANRSNFTSKEEYVYGIKKSFTLSRYKEQFNYIDFKDNSYKYSNLQESNLINVYNDMIKSIKENNSKIIINKYHLIFIYYLNDISNLNNLIILILDNENEFDILECYENANQKVHKIKNKDNNKDKNKEIQNGFQNKRNNRKLSKSPKRKNSKSPRRKSSKSPNRNAPKSNRKQYISNDDKKNDYNNNRNENKKINSKKSKNKNNSKNNNDKNPQEKEDKTGNEESDKKKNSGIIEKNTTNKNNNNNDKKRNQSHRSNSPISQNESNKKIEKRKEKKEKEYQKEKEINNNIRNEKGKSRSKNLNKENDESIDNKLKDLKSPTKAEKERITKNFLYGEYNFSNFQPNEEEHEIEQKSETSEKNEKNSNNKEEKEKDDESDWDLSLFDEEEEKEEEETKKNNNNNKNENNEKNEEVKSNISGAESKKENEINFDFDGKNDKNINLIGKKINREDSQELIKGEKSQINNFQKEKKNNDYMDMDGELIKKDLINNPCSLITISESEDENNNNIKNTTENQSGAMKYNNDMKIQKLPKNKNGKILSFEQNFSPQINYSVQLPESPSLYSIESINSEISNISPKIKNKFDIHEKMSNYDQSLLKYLSYPSQIIEKSIEIQKLKDKIEKHNDLYLKLVYTSIKEKDDYSTFKNAVIDKYRLLILVKTTKGRKFALYFNEKIFSSKDKINQEIIDMMGFIFSFEKYRFYVPTERLICFTRSPPNPYLFKLSDYSIYIKNNFKSCKHHFGDSNKVFNIKNISEELNEGEKEYDIDIVEVYRAEIPYK